MSLKIIVIEVTIDHLAFKAQDMVIGTFDLKKRTIVTLELTMEITLVDTTATEADVTQMAFFTGVQAVDRSLQVELMTFRHEGFDGAPEYVAIGFYFGDTVAIIDFAVGTNGDTAKTTIAVGLIRCVTFHKVDVLGIGIDLVFDVDNPVVELVILSIGVMRVASLKYFFAEFEENGMLTLALDVANHLGITLGGVVLQILEGECGGNRCADAAVGHEDDIAYHTVEMASTTNLGIGMLVEAIDANLNLANGGREACDLFFGPENAVGENGRGKTYLMRMGKNGFEVAIHQGFTP